MTLTNGMLILFILILFIFTIYDQFIIPRRNGVPLLTISLLRHSRADGMILVGLIAILLYSNILHHGLPVTTWLLSVLELLILYLLWIRQPQIVFKSTGFFFNSCWMSYNQISEMGLSEDGILMIKSEQKRLLIRVRNIDDLDVIYKFLITNQ